MTPSNSIRLSFVIACVIVIIACDDGLARRIEPPIKGTIPPTYFGLHIHRLGSPTPWPSVSFTGWRIWDAGVGWATIEPDPGVWNFSKLDRYIASAEQHGVEPLIVLGMPPAWASSRPTEKAAYQLGSAAEPRDLNEWGIYVRTVAARYKGRVHHYEVWNEPNLAAFYTGTVNSMVNLARKAYEVLKQVDPEIKVVSPSATAKGGVFWLDEYLTKGGGRYADVIGYHFYVPGPPEDTLSLIRKIRDVMAKHGLAKMPLWNTESGWSIQNTSGGMSFSQNTSALPSQIAAAYVARAYVINWLGGVTRFYFYAWDDRKMGLTEADGMALKPSALAYAEIQRWLRGTELNACYVDDEQTWACKLLRLGRVPVWIVWNPMKSLNFTSFTKWRSTQVRTLFGEIRSLASLRAIPVGPMPLLFEPSEL